MYNMYYIPQNSPSQSSVSLQSSSSSETGQSSARMRELPLFVDYHHAVNNAHKHHSTMSIAGSMRVGQIWRCGSIGGKNQLLL